MMLSSAMMIMMLTACGDDGDSKQIKLADNKDALGAMIELNTDYVVYSYTLDDSGAFDKQLWVVEVPFKVLSDDLKGMSANEVKSMMNVQHLNIDILDEKGQKVLSPLSYGLAEADETAFYETLAKGKDAVGVLKFTWDTSNSDKYKEWFESGVTAKLDIPSDFNFYEPTSKDKGNKYMYDYNWDESHYSDSLNEGGLELFTESATQRVKGSTTYDSQEAIEPMDPYVRARDYRDTPGEWHNVYDSEERADMPDMPNWDY